ncbi:MULTISPECIES: hypothetical protein [unclassified Microcystis]|jgi:hypothetical protein|uniref:Uncharacterized protein n=3 Tax=Microcystis aeruginosa TaxID=1126 RepID=A0A552FUL2_MICAE|nr:MULTISPECIES: hypothetical protein [unclassified Microcystis]MCA2927465.1 hypothetical protein [Microcystis sp. M020S1]MCA2933440.1 hypothetical protein [Microcystis sp. M015S1]MCU7242683.1 hypothetical protein [Microcystis aeruginosa WS75]NCQ69274.1 hypothetical protein [Microcystis aeruginosa W13-16]NCQ73843.1 hypothetical protein [Microcystis aeruginosa W13-13]NCQ78319.1 hypothetical protein [Microcystis aeruginosa W13-15]NCQ87154.1 hypothetical protein [Microcystis aeruginosa W13-18]
MSLLQSRTTAVVTCPQANTWVQLRMLPSPYSFDEALLLCEQDQGRWVAWIPDFGEIILIEGQFEG